MTFLITDRADGEEYRGEDLDVIVRDVWGVDACLSLGEYVSTTKDRFGTVAEHDQEFGGSHVLASVIVRNESLYH